MITSKKQTVDTVGDFGKQWTEFTDNTSFYGSVEALDSLFGPLLDKQALAGKRIADVGAGTGRYTLMFHELGVAKILALEPSEAMQVLQRNTRGLGNIDYLRGRADELPQLGFDFVFCIGVLQFIPDPKPALDAMGRALGRNGRLFLWVYGEENNGLYLALVRPLRRLSTRLPHRALLMLSGLLRFPADVYAWFCRFLPLPLADYMRNYFSKLDRYSRKVVVYDQLNPKIAHYYRRQELVDLLRERGFVDIQLHHRLGYSWSVLARYSPQTGTRGAPVSG